MTTNDPFSLLAGMLKHPLQPCNGSAFGRSDQLRPLINLGVLVPEGYMRTVVCGECETPHPAPVVQTDCGPGWICARLGCKFDAEEDLTAYRVRPEFLVEELTSALGATDKGRLVAGHRDLWTLGSVPYETYRIELYFTPLVQKLEDFVEVLSHIRSRPRVDGIGVLTGDALDLDPQLLPGHTAVIPLREVSEIDGAGCLSADLVQIARRVLPASLFSSPRRGAPAKQREKIFAVLEFMTQNGESIDTSNAGLREIASKFEDLYPIAKVPVADTIRKAIGQWQDER